MSGPECLLVFFQSNHAMADATVTQHVSNNMNTSRNSTHSHSCGQGEATRGKEGTDRRYCQRPVHRVGMRQAFRAFGPSLLSHI